MCECSLVSHEWTGERKEKQRTRRPRGTGTVNTVLYYACGYVTKTLAMTSPSCYDVPRSLSSEVEEKGAQ